MYKYNSINHTNEKTEAFYCLKNNYDKEKTKYYTSPLSDNPVSYTHLTLPTIA